MDKDTEKYLRGLIREEIEDSDEMQAAIDEIAANGEVVYHRPKDGEKDNPLQTINGLFTYGFSREYTGSNGGNMYGEGVYNVYTLRSSNEKATGYGHYIVKSYVIDGYKDFLIFNRDIAKNYYGDNYDIRNQIRLLMPPFLADKVLNSRRCARLFMNDYNSLYLKTSDCALDILKILKNDIYKTKVRGIIYDGGHDGSCAFVRDFTAVCPFAYSEDNGRTWKQRISQNLIRRLTGTIDPEFELRHRVDDNGKKIVNGVSNNSINGHNIISKSFGGKTKFNLYSAIFKKPISPVWFDFVTDFNDDMESNVLLNGKKYIIYYDNDEDKYCVYDEFGEYICDLDDIGNI